jgi:hypothetical protein
MQASLDQPQLSTPSAGLAMRPWEGLVLALIAGAVLWGFVQRVHPVFHMPKEFEAPSIGMPAEVYLANRRAQERIDRRHAMLYVGGLGLLVAAALGFREGTRRRTILPSFLAAPLGAMGGALGAYLGSRVHEYTIEHIGQPELLHTVLAQGAIFVPLGLAVGLGVGLAAPLRAVTAKAAVAGLLAGTAAALAYPVVVSLLLPKASTDLLLPIDGPSRLLWLELGAGLLGLLIPIAGRSRAK